MLRVTLQQEPDTFDTEVRLRGTQWCRRQNIDLDRPVPPGTRLKDYWRNCLPYMRERYQYFCAYTNIIISPGEGAIDHFHPKNKHPREAYEWKNYRLTLPRINSRKGEFEDVLDPCSIKEGWFQLDFIFGSVSPNPNISSPIHKKVKKTIDRLLLNDPMYKKYRLTYINDYIEGQISARILKRDAPYIYCEMKRQNILKEGDVL